VKNPIYINDGFERLVSLLHKLKVFEVKHHRVSHVMTMIRGSGVQSLIQPHWIPLPVADTSMHFIEIVPRGQGE
jgi:hypothetical protein